LRKVFPKKEEVRPEKTVILIDGENLWFSLIELGRLEISDFKEFKKRLSEGKELVRIVYFRSVEMEPEYPEKTLRTLGFLAYLESLGYEIEKRPLSKGKLPKSEIDPVIAVEICRSAIDKNVSAITLLSGDGHFVPAIEFAKEKGKKVIVVSTAGSLSAKLKKVSDQWIDLRKIVEGITEKSEIEEKRKGALEKINKGKKIRLSDFKEIP